MFTDNVDDGSIDGYKAIELEFHRDIMNICRKYINHLTLVSVIGTLDMAKNETIELMRATRKDMSDEK